MTSSPQKKNLNNQGFTVTNKSPYIPSSPYLEGAFTMLQKIQDLTLREWTDAAVDHACVFFEGGL